MRRRGLAGELSIARNDRCFDGLNLPRAISDIDQSSGDTSHHITQETRRGDPDLDHGRLGSVVPAAGDIKVSNITHATLTVGVGGAECGPIVLPQEKPRSLGHAIHVQRF